MTSMHLALAALLLVAGSASLAQPAAPAAPAAAAAVSPTKKELVAKVLQLQQSGYDAFAAQLVLGPAAQMQQQLRGLVQRAPAERREALARELEGELIKYADEVTPIAREAVRRLLPSTVGPILEQRMTDEELRQVIAVLESPAHRKFLSLGNDMQGALAERLVTETRAQVQPKVQALEQAVTRRLSAAAPPAAGAAPAPGTAPAAPR